MLLELHIFILKELNFFIRYNENIRIEVNSGGNLSILKFRNG